MEEKHKMDINEMHGQQIQYEIQSAIDYMKK